MSLIKRFWGLFFLLIFSIVAVKPIFITGFFPMHDDTQPARVYEMAKALRDGMFPVRWSEDLGYGYGYPLFNFYAPFAYYFGSIFTFIGFDALAATKIMMGLGMVIAGVAMYLFAREFWGKAGGAIAALLYLYAPYHAVQLYVRGDVAELFAYGILPLVFLAIYKIRGHLVASRQSRLNRDQSPVASLRAVWNWVALGAVSYAAVITSHNLSALMITPFLISTILLITVAAANNNRTIEQLNNYKSRIFYCLRYSLLLTMPLLIGVLLSAFYWLPAIGEMKYTNVLSQIGGKADPNLHFVCPLQIWDSPWGFGGSAPGCVDGMSFRLGKLHIVLPIIAVGLTIVFWKRKNIRKKPVMLSAVFLLLSLWLMTPLSSFLWNNLPLMNFLQYPWRFLLPASFFSSFLGGAAVSILLAMLNLSFKVKASLVLILSSVILLLYAKLFAPQTIVPKSAGDYTSYNSLNWKISKISDEYLPRGFHKPENPDEIPSSAVSVPKEVDVSILQKKTQLIRADITAGQQIRLLLNIAYFPAWKTYINGKQATYTTTDKGLAVEISPGKSELVLVFRQTVLETAADILSIAGVLVLILGIMKKARN